MVAETMPSAAISAVTSLARRVNRPLLREHCPFVPRLRHSLGGVETSLTRLVNAPTSRVYTPLIPTPIFHPRSKDNARPARRLAPVLISRRNDFHHIGGSNRPPPSPAWLLSASPIAAALLRSTSSLGEEFGVFSCGVEASRSALGAGSGLELGGAAKGGRSMGLGARKSLSPPSISDRWSKNPLLAVRPPDVLVQPPARLQRHGDELLSRRSCAENDALHRSRRSPVLSPGAWEQAPRARKQVKSSSRQVGMVASQHLA